MTTPRTLRRKLHKKHKHKPYRKCPQCGKRCTMTLKDDHCHSFCLPRLFVVCGGSKSGRECNSLVSTGTMKNGCGFVRELFWTKKT